MGIYIVFELGGDNDSCYAHHHIIKKIFEDITDETNARPRVDIWTADSISKFDKSYLESKMKPYIEFKEKYNIPLYCGEYGACYVAFEENRGGERWVGDMIDILSESNFLFESLCFPVDKYSSIKVRTSLVPTKLI